MTFEKGGIQFHKSSQHNGGQSLETSTPNLHINPKVLKL